MPTTVVGVIRRIVVGADGSSASAAAIQWAADLAHALGAQVTLVHAADLVERFQTKAADERSFEEELRVQIDRDCGAPLRHRGVVYEVVVRPGPPAQMLLDVAAGGGELIVVGRRSGSTTDITRLGSTSQELAARASLPVVVVADHGTFGPGAASESR